MDKELKIAKLREIRKHNEDIAYLYEDLEQFDIANEYKAAAKYVSREAFRLEQSIVDWSVGDLAFDNYNCLWVLTWDGWRTALGSSDPIKTIEQLEDRFGPIRPAHAVEGKKEDK